jgi:hypothetical protein
MANTWKRVWMVLHNSGVGFRIYGERSDGAIVYVETAVRLDDSAEAVLIDTKNALQTLDAIWKDKEPVNGN